MKIIGLCLLLLPVFAVAAGDTANGEKLYKKCAACHGPQGQGNKSQAAPRIAGQHDWYIVSSIETFLSGKRPNPKMLPFIKGLSKKDIEDLAAYVSKMQ